jgi:Flp pilus assembly protein TadD
VLTSLPRLLAVLALSSGLAACKLGTPDFSATLNTTLPTTEQALQAEAQRLGPVYEKKPGEKQISLRYGQVLRQLGRTQQAVAVLQQAAIRNLNDRDVSAAYGKALADNGQYKEASEVLPLAHTPDRPNWQILSVQGSVADQLGDHGRAQEFYSEALKIAPGEPSVLSNLGLSYALEKRIAEAERVLVQAAAHPRADARVTANLEMVRRLKKTGVQQAGPTNAWAEIRKAEAARKSAAR